MKVNVHGLFLGATPNLRTGLGQRCPGLARVLFGKQWETAFCQDNTKMEAKTANFCPTVIVPGQLPNWHKFDHTAIQRA